MVVLVAVFGLGLHGFWQGVEAVLVGGGRVVRVGDDLVDHISYNYINQRYSNNGKL